MSKQGRFSFFLVLGLCGISAVTSAVETSTIPPDQLFWYLCLRIPLLLWGVGTAFVFRKNPYSNLGHFLFGALLILYSMHGQWYRPFYEYTFFQAMVFYTLLMYPPKRVFMTILIGGSLLFMAVYVYRFDEVVLNSRTTLNENYTALIAFSLTIFGIYKIFSEGRAFKEQALARFGLLGKHSATILHDLKATVAIPRIYTELAEEALDRGDTDQLRLRLKECLHSLDSMQTIIVQLNQMSQLTQFNAESVALCGIVEEVREVLRVKLNGIRFEVTGDTYIEASRSFMFSVILNLVMNSVEIFNERETTKPFVKIAISKRNFIYSDNGGGFLPELLARMEDGIQASTKAQASGLGLFLLRDRIREIGGKVFFSNSSAGVVVEIQFKS